MTKPTSLTRLAATLLAASTLAASALPAFAYTGEAYAKDAKISLMQARAAAQAAQPGKIVDTELEKESGGSGLRYSFDIKPDTTSATHEVGVDAQTGAILENSVDGATPD